MHIDVHKAGDRGLSTEPWLRSHHSFSFNTWMRPDRMGFGVLRVLNDDVIAGGGGFGTHGHKDMEIVTIVLNGALEHQDSSGGSGMIRPGEVQRMSAGKGVFHSEFNASKTEPVELLQIWVTPKEKGIVPSYEQRRFDFRDNLLRRVVDGNRRDGALYLHQDASFFLGRLTRGAVVEHLVENKRGVYVFLISGSLEVDGRLLSPRDAAAVTGAEMITLNPLEPSHILVIEMPMGNTR